MESFDIVFCVLTYKSYQDLDDFVEGLKSVKQDFTYKIIVVNNFADQESLIKIRNIAKTNKCDFIENENTGYSDGNNKGIDHAKNTYKFKFLVVCNPDTIIKNMDFEKLGKYNKEIIAPQIRCINNKNQNPLYFKYMPFSEKLVYNGFRKRNRLVTIFGILLNKIDRFIGIALMNMKSEISHDVYACHGSFIIFSQNTIEKLFPVFDSNIFLFCEESDLARKAKKLGIRIIYDSSIEIFHKEDGSMSLSSDNLYEIHRDSYLYYYEKWNDR